MSDPWRVVYDCNVLLQALARPGGPSGRSVQLALDREVELFLSRQVLDELSEVASRPLTIRKLHLVPERTAEFIDALAATSFLLGAFAIPFTYRRDPDGAVYVNLAIAAGASLVVSRDADLLDLITDVGAEAKLFRRNYPGLQIVDPPTFLRAYDEAHPS